MTDREINIIKGQLRTYGLEVMVFHVYDAWGWSIAGKKLRYASESTYTDPGAAWEAVRDFAIEKIF